MKVSRAWLQTFFDTPLPEDGEIERLLTFHSSEVEAVIEHEDDTVFDIKVLPDKSAWMLSHRGIAKEVSVVLDVPLAHDPLSSTPDLAPVTDTVSITRTADACDRYAGVLIEGVTVAESPPWLRKFLTSVGQRPINNIVDATNYVMFHIGQPLHAFDAEKLSGDKKKISVRMASEGEALTTLTGESYTLSEDDMLIVDGETDAPIGIAGVKGGKAAEIDNGTKCIFIESAHFDRTSVRLTSQRLRLRTDASARFENGVAPHMVAYGLREVSQLVVDLAGGTVAGYVDSGIALAPRKPVSVSLSKINDVLGRALSEEDVRNVMRRFGYEHVFAGDILTVTPPFERDDLIIPEDLIEEIGRIHGLSHIPSLTPTPLPLNEFNKQFFYAEEVRNALVALGFSEVFTSSFRDTDSIRLANALASDKAYLRSTLRNNLEEALERNVPNKDLLGLPHIAIFEIGTVFGTDGEYVSLAFGVRTDGTYNAKKDDAVIQSAIVAVSGVVGTEHFEMNNGIAECDFTAAIADLPDPTAYAPRMKYEETVYTPFSPYPFVVRDIALWAPEEVALDEVRALLLEHGGALLVRQTLFDVFEKDGRTSYALRLVFQSPEKTLTDEAVNAVMDDVSAALTRRGCEVR